VTVSVRFVRGMEKIPEEVPLPLGRSGSFKGLPRRRRESRTARRLTVEILFEGETYYMESFPELFFRLSEKRRENQTRENQIYERYRKMDDT
jgi:hypothetical protein